MKRLKLDHNKLRGAQRAMQYVRIDRQDGPHPATVALHRRPTEIAHDSRVERYTSIERSTR